MNYIILCDTTYQILSAISFRLGHTTNEDRVDLIVDTLRTSNVNMKDLAERIKEKKVFTHVYCIGNLQKKYRRIGHVIKMLEWIEPGSIYKLMTKGIKRDCNYDVIVVSGPFSTQRCLIAAYPHSIIYYIEDGLGSYIGRLGINELSWRGKIAQRIVKYSPLHIYPQSVYLYSPEFYVGEYKQIVKRLKFPIKHIEMLDRIYSVDIARIKELYRNFRFVFFSQLLNASSVGYQFEKSLIDRIKENYKDDFIVRPHPRGELSIFEGLNIDNSYSQWELCCAEIDEESILIGGFSTSLFAPKLIHNIEPIVVFTYRLYGHNYVDEAVNRLRNIYTDKQKVICVSSMEELLETINILKKV